MKDPTLESLAKLKHLLRYLSGNKLSVLRLRPSQTLSDWKCILDIQCFVDSDWAGCSKTRKATATSDCIVQVLDCDIIHSSRTQANVALSSGASELYAIGQGINESLYVRNIILEAEFVRKVTIEAFTDSAAGKSMATRFGSGKRTEHVQLRYLYMQNMDILQVKKVGAKNNPTNLLTPYVSPDTLKSLIHKLVGIVQNNFKL